MKEILDACCGGRMFWYDRQNEKTIYMDNREYSGELCDGSIFEVKPDIIGDFTAIPFDDNTFSMVVFDPPHLKKKYSGWISIKYGFLPENWKSCIAAGFRECFRVLKPSGVLIFKWSPVEIPFADVIKLSPELPLFGDTGNKKKTRWTVFMKGARPKKDQELF